MISLDSWAKIRHLRSQGLSIRAIAASAVPEQFASRGRFTGMAFGYNLATVLFGGLTPFIVTVLMRDSGNVLAPAYYALGIALLAGVPTLALMRRLPATV